MDVFLAGAGVARFGRREGSLADLAREAAAAALTDAGLEAGDIDHLFVATQFPESLAGQANAAAWIAGAIGTVPAPATRIETAPSSGAAALHAAVAAVGAGLAERALVVGAETMTRVPTDVASRVLADMIDPRERRYGLTMPALVALMTRRAMRDHGVTREDLALAAVKAHAHGARNPDAQFRKPVSVEDVLRSPLVADPLRVFDCAPMSDGAAALLVTARPSRVRVAGLGQATDTLSLAERPGNDFLTGFRATRLAADQAFARAGWSRRDVDVLETHDAFTLLEITNLADLGFATVAESAAMLRAGETALGGRLPTNLGGGLKARGHPVGATGVAQVAELVRQLRGEAGPRQADRARRALAHNIGGLGNNVLVTLLEAVA
ncbi:MAG TPA: hypothetical protein VM889_00520 [Candidatus Thermoplasmatota archaeon]|nr:hypothetical protein [Candidatus Thermoplasmatota archaeon]